MDMQIRQNHQTIQISYKFFTQLVHQLKHTAELTKETLDNSEDLMDIQEELEKKFDELFGKNDDSDSTDM